MARPRHALQNRLEEVAVRFIFATLTYAPLPVAFRLTAFYASLMDRFSPRMRRAAMRNLSAALPDLPVEKRRAMVDAVFRSAGRVLLTFARFPSLRPDSINQWIRYEGMEHVDRVLARGRGLLFATGHLGNWELSAFAFAWMAQPIAIVVRPLDNPLLDRLVRRYRELSGNRTITKRDYARGILQALAKNQMVGILADQNDSDGIFIDFFGRPAATSPGIAKLAAKTGAGVVPGFALWSEAERKYVLRFYAEVPITGEVTRDTQAIHASIEGVIREYPDQWLWIHRRWKTQPRA